MSRLLLVTAAAAVALAGCAELYRWPDRMSRGPSARRAELPPDGHYVVKPGDTMYSIAFRHQLDFRELAVWNDIGPDYLIRPGQVLRLAPPAVAGSGAIQTRPLEPRDHEPDLSPRELATAPRWSWPTQGTIVKHFAESNGKGIDIAGDLGQPVLAAAPGRVVYSGAALKGYGELIIIKHDEVHLSAYGYNRRRLVSEGVQVTAGQPIAELGLGPEQKPVLHFEVRRKGKPVDPLTYLASR